MGRFLILLTIGSAVIFVMVLTMPLKSITTSGLSANESEINKPVKDPIRLPVSGTARKPAHRKALRGPSPLKPSKARTQTGGQNLETPPSDGAENGSWATVSSDSAEIYSMNFPRGTMLHSLNKGEKVQTDLEVVDAEGGWTLVKGPGPRAVGFVRSENLERKLSAEATRR